MSEQLVVHLDALHLLAALLQPGVVLTELPDVVTGLGQDAALTLDRENGVLWISHDELLQTLHLNSNPAVTSWEVCCPPPPPHPDVGWLDEPTSLPRGLPNGRLV